MSNTKEINLPKAGSKRRRVADALLAGKVVTTFTAERFKLSGSSMPSCIKVLKEKYRMKIAHCWKHNPKTKTHYIEYKLAA